MRKQEVDGVLEKEFSVCITQGRDAFEYSVSVKEGLGGYQKLQAIDWEEA